MIPAPLPANEQQRLQALRNYYVLDSSAEAAFDAIARAASALCGTPMGLISLVDERRQWFKAKFGLEATQTPREQAFCAHAVASGQMLEVPDALADQRFADNPLVTGNPNIRFYAGAPLTTAEGHTLGTLCVLDRKPGNLSAAQQEALNALAEAVMAMLEAHRQQAHEHLLGQVVDGSLNQIFLIDAQSGQLIHVSSGALDDLGYDGGELDLLDGNALLERCCGRQRGELVAELNQSGNEPFEIDAVLQRRDGTHYPVEGQLQLWRLAHQQLCVLYLRNVARRRKVELALQESELRAQAIADNLPALIAEVDSDLRYRFCNAAYAHVFGGNRAQMIGRHLAEVGEQVYPAIQNQVEAVLAGKAQRFEGSMQVGDQHFEYESRFVPKYDGDGAVVGFFAMTHDIGDRKRLEAVLRRQATHDPLTGLPNRTLLQSHLESALLDPRNKGRHIAVCFLDVDHFKQVNDVHGHALGDLVLRTIAARLRECVADSGLAARLAGDEFVLIVEGLADKAALTDFADRLLRCTGEPLVHRQLRLPLSTSVGIALWPEHGANLEALLHRADTALYEVKRGGRGRWALAHESTEKPPQSLPGKS